MGVCVPVCLFVSECAYVRACVLAGLTARRDWHGAGYVVPARP